MQVDLSDRPNDARWWRWIPVWAGIALLYGVVLHTQVAVPLVPAVTSSAVYFFSLALLMVPISRISERLLSERHADVAAAHIGSASHRRRLAGDEIAHYRIVVGRALGDRLREELMFQPCSRWPSTARRA
jgi:hypothetical protein